MSAENAEWAVLSQDRVYENLSFRANVIAYLKACVALRGERGEMGKVDRRLRALVVPLRHVVQAGVFRGSDKGSDGRRQAPTVRQAPSGQAQPAGAASR